MGWIAVSKLATRRVPLISRQLLSTPFLASLTHHELKSSGLSSLGTVIMQKAAFTGARFVAGLPISSGMLSTIGARHFSFAVSRFTSADAHVRELASTLPPPAVEEGEETTSTAEQASSLSGVEIVNDEDGNTISPTSASPGRKFALHPWAEWTAFVNQLHIQGYFDSERNGEVTALKLAFRHFARRRNDIYSHLPRTELEVLAGAGCPNPERKVVLAAKRLRFDLGIKEAPVCDDCFVRIKCIRPYKDPDSKASASLTHVVRLLLTYGLYARKDGSSVPLKVKTAAEALLREMTRLSEIPSLPPPPTDLMAEQPVVFNTPRPPIEARPGDWVCQECNYPNFARIQKCRRCAAEAPGMRLDRPPSAHHWSNEDGMRGVQGNGITHSESDGDESAVYSERMQHPSARSPVNSLPGNWFCPECSYSNFARNRSCRRCEADAPPRSTVDGQPPLRDSSSDYQPPARDAVRGWQGKGITLSESDGDYSAVFSERVQPSSARLPLNSLPDDWVCPKCSYLNFARNQRCRKCEADAPPRSKVDSQPPLHDSSNDYQPPPRDNGYRSMFRERDSDDAAVPSRRTQRELQPGDWFCPECSYHNFARNRKCRICDATGAPASEATDESYGESMHGQEWEGKPREELSVGARDFASIDEISHDFIPMGDGELRLEEEVRQDRSSYLDGEIAPDMQEPLVVDETSGDDSNELLTAGDNGYRSMLQERDSENTAVPSRRTQHKLRRGDWICPGCTYHNFARNQTCRICNATGAPASEAADESYGERGNGHRSMSQERDSDDSAAPSRRTQRELLRGDWICPECSYHNFARNRTCRICYATGAPASEASDESYGKSMHGQEWDENPGEGLSVGARDSASIDEISHDFIPLGDGELRLEEEVPQDRSSYLDGEIAPDMQEHLVVDETSGDVSNEFLTARSSNGGHGSFEEGMRPRGDESKPSWERVSEPCDLNDDGVDEDESPAPQTRPEEIVCREEMLDLYEGFTPEAREYWNADKRVGRL